MEKLKSYIRYMLVKFQITVNSYSKITHMVCMLESKTINFILWTIVTPLNLPVRFFPVGKQYIYPQQVSNAK